MTLPTIVANLVSNERYDVNTSHEAYTLSALGRLFLFVPCGDPITPIVNVKGTDHYAMWLQSIRHAGQPYEAYELHPEPVHY